MSKDLFAKFTNDATQGQPSTGKPTIQREATVLVNLWDKLVRLWAFEQAHGGEGFTWETNNPTQLFYLNTLNKFRPMITTWAQNPHLHCIESSDVEEVKNFYRENGFNIPTDLPAQMHKSVICLFKMGQNWFKPGSLCFVQENSGNFLYAKHLIYDGDYSVAYSGQNGEVIFAKELQADDASYTCIFVNDPGVDDQVELLRYSHNLMADIVNGLLSKNDKLYHVFVPVIQMHQRDQDKTFEGMTYNNQPASQDRTENMTQVDELGYFTQSLGRLTSLRGGGDTHVMTNPLVILCDDGQITGTPSVVQIIATGQDIKIGEGHQLIADLKEEFRLYRRPANHDLDGNYLS